MNLFDHLVDEALSNNTELSTLRIVVEKELLHHDILRTMSEAGFLAQLTFIGGTCLRTCYGSQRLSEDLDFTGGADFNRESLSDMAHHLQNNIEIKYGLHVKIKEPLREIGNVDTWTLQVQTRPMRKDLPTQRINIDICAIPSYQVHPMMLQNPYGVDMGTSGLIINAQSLEEIFSDKLIAFALRPNRMKYRDLWDMSWLHQKNIKPSLALIPNKINDHHYQKKVFLELLNDRTQLLKNNPQFSHEFHQEMRRFLPSSLYQKTFSQATFWDFLTNMINTYCEEIQHYLSS